MDAVGTALDPLAATAFWREVADSMPQMAWINDPTGNPLWFNRSFLTYTGAPIDELMTAWSQFHHPDHKGRVIGSFARSLETGEAWQGRYPLRGRGGYRWFLGHAQPLRDAEGRITHWFGTNTDITDQMTAEDQAQEATKRLNAILDNTTMGVFLMDERQQCVFANAAAESLTGYSFDQMQGRPLHDVIHHKKPDGSYYPLEECPIDRAFPEHARTKGEELFVAPDGSFYPVAFTASPLLDEAGKPVGTVIEARNIEERRAREAALRESEERYRTVFASAAVGIGRVSPEGPFLEVNDRFCDILGRSREEILSCGWKEITHQDDLEADVALVERALRGEIDSYTLEKRYLAKDGEDIWVSLTVSAERHADGSVKFFIPVVADIRERKAAEAALRRSEERYRALFESMEQGFCVLQVTFEGDQPADYRFSEINPAFSEQSGLGKEVLHKSVKKVVPDLEGVWFERYGRVAWTGQSVRFTEHAAALGRWFDVYAFRIGDPLERNVAVLFTDITAQREQQLALERSEAQLRAVLEAAPVGLVFADATGQITGGNARVEEIIGRPIIQSEAVERYKHDYVAFHRNGRQVESEEYPLAKVIAGQAARAELVCHVQRGDGSRAWVRYVATSIRDVDGTLTGGVVASIDIDREVLLTEGLEREVEKIIAEREQAQEALRQSQKLEAMGQLTGGVAHDFNNLLTPIIGSLDLLQRKGEGDARTQRLVNGALQSAERAKVLVQRLLAFARRQPLQPTAVDVGQVVSDMADLVASTSGPRVRVEVDVARDLPAACADSNQLEMALLNLSVNARDAMPEGGSIRIGVRAETVVAGQEGLAKGRHIVLTVADTGTGMDGETLRRAIEPFFSTKGIGKGTGLGLSMVHGLAAQLGGALRISSKPGEGTAVELWLPVAADAAAVPIVPSRESRLSALGTALLVDDEELVRASTAAMLTDLGYEVVETDSAEAAWSALDDGLAPDLLVTDHLMPGITGTDLAKRVRSRLPGLPILVVSGYADLDGLVGDIPYLAKPFRQADLAESLTALTPTAGTNGG
ncbi:PAS domain S-box protein [Sphingomonas sp. GCM10030256]|uniref:PAS domain S-box protein n=1 Tax=Sphingomonas sp. GCM10030256 TaxID=3273427 RepID=UPI00360D24CA